MAIEQDQSKNRLRIKLTFTDDQEASFLLDTGAVASLINMATLTKLSPIFAAELKRNPQLIPETQTLRDFNGNKVNTRGLFDTRVKCGKWHTTAQFHVIEKGTNIAAMDIIPNLGFLVHQQAKSTEDDKGKPHSLKINQWSNTEIQNEFNKRFPNLFTRVGRVNHHMVRNRFMKNFKPIQQKGRRIPITIQPKVEEELNRLLREGHIDKLGTCTDDISPVVITVKKDGTCKIALDFKAINKVIYKNRYQMHTDSSKPICP